MGGKGSGGAVGAEASGTEPGSKGPRLEGQVPGDTDMGGSQQEEAMAGGKAKSRSQAAYFPSPPPRLLPCPRPSSIILESSWIWLNVVFFSKFESVTKAKSCIVHDMQVCGTS